ncbi:hypothetical protein Tco_0737908 [Tanacetum coccineum]
MAGYRCALCRDYLCGYFICRVNAPAGRPLGAYDLGFATPRALVCAGVMTSRDARSWYMISGDAKSREAPSEFEEFQPLVSREPLIDEEFEVSEPSNIRITSSHSSASSDSTTPLSLDHPLTQALPTPTPT